MPSREGPPFAIDHVILYQILADPRFYSDVPAFLFLKDQALAITAQIKNELVDPSTCAGCASIRVRMGPLMQIFVQHLKKMHDEAPQSLVSFVDFITLRRNYRPKPILVYYRDSTDVMRTIKL